MSVIQLVEILSLEALAIYLIEHSAFSLAGNCLEADALCLQEATGNIVAMYQ